MSPETIMQWELGRKTPQLRFIPRIIRFLGYCPWTPPRYPGERFRRARVSLGLTQEAAAKALGVDSGTVSRWESGARRPPAGWAKALLSR